MADKDTLARIYADGRQVLAIAEMPTPHPYISLNHAIGPGIGFNHDMYIVRLLYSHFQTPGKEDATVVFSGNRQFGLEQQSHTWSGKAWRESRSLGDNIKLQLTYDDFFADGNLPEQIAKNDAPVLFTPGRIGPIIATDRIYIIKPSNKADKILIVTYIGNTDAIPPIFRDIVRPNLQVPDVLSVQIRNLPIGDEDLRLDESASAAFKRRLVIEG